MQRILTWWTTAAGAARRLGQRLWSAARDPRRVLPVLVVASLLVLAVPLTVTGLARIGRAALDWRQDSGIVWRETRGLLDEVRGDDGLRVRVGFVDEHGERQEAVVFLGTTGRRWVDAYPRIRYDRRDPSHAEIIGFAEPDPVPGLLLAGAPLGAGIAMLVLAVGSWRRRRLVMVSARPLVALRPVLVPAGTILLVGIGAWAAGTVWQRGWSAVASGSGHLAGRVFGDLLGVLVPVVAFAAGALVTAWLARHRHSDEHEGILGSAHRFIDRAASIVPSPEDLRPDATVARRGPDPEKVPSAPE